LEAKKDFYTKLEDKETTFKPTIIKLKHSQTVKNALQMLRTIDLLDGSPRSDYADKK
jgi:hypothetical protein